MFSPGKPSHVAGWAQRKNLKLNREKSVEIIFRDRKRKQQFSDPPTLPDIQRDTQIKILGATITNHLPVSEYVRDVIGKVDKLYVSEFFVTTA